MNPVFVALLWCAVGVVLGAFGMTKLLFEVLRRCPTHLARGILWNLAHAFADREDRPGAEALTCQDASCPHAGAQLCGICGTHYRREPFEDPTVSTLWCRECGDTEPLHAELGWASVTSGAVLCGRVVCESNATTRLSGWHKKAKGYDLTAPMRVFDKDENETDETEEKT